MATVKYYDADKVRAALTWPMVNAAIKAAFIAVSSHAVNDENKAKKSSFANQPARSITACDEKFTKILLTMPSFVGNYNLDFERSSSTANNTLACKLVTSFSANSTKNPPVPNILAHVLLFSSETGALESIVEGTQITGWRTASASLVATKFLYFEREKLAAEKQANEAKINVAIIGCGVQGQSHALGLCATYKVNSVMLWNRTQSKADNLAALLRKEYPAVDVMVCADPAAAVADADVICVATYSPNALINHSMIKKEAVHINTVGAGQVHFGEVAQDIYDAAEVYVDSWANAKVELKDLKANIVAEVGEVINSCKRLPKNGITIFQSMGMAAEDATVAHAVVEAIKEKQ